MNRIAKGLSVVWLAMLLAACQSTSENALTDNQRLLQDLAGIEIQSFETERGLVIHFPDINFKFNSAELNTAAVEKLGQIAEKLSSDYVADRTLAVEGHTDGVGEEAFNMQLSKSRAEAVFDELVVRNISTERVNIDWFGEAAPIAPNNNPDGTDNPAGREKNRRVEIIVLNPS